MTPPMPSAFADPRDERGRSVCGRHCKSTGRPCKRSPSGGVPGKPCKMHGGGAPQVKAAVERAKQEIAIRRTAAEIVKDAVPVTDPLRALQAFAGRVLAFEAAVSEQVDILQMGYSSEIGTEQMRTAVGVYMQAMQQARGVLVDMARLKLDERLMAIQEGTAQMVLRAIQAALELSLIHISEPT